MAVTAEVEDRVGWITLDRPPDNRFDVAVLEELDRCVGEVAGHADRGHQPRRTWIWTLVEALAYAGAAFDPAAALAAQRLARVRDEELHRTGVR